MLDLFSEQDPLLLLPEPKRRLGILLTGPNCSGKTTMAYKSIAGYEKDARVLFLDQDKHGQIPMETIKGMLAEAWLSKASIVIVAGTSRAANGMAQMLQERDGRALRPIEVLVTEMEPEVFAAHMRQRCAANNKKFREDYWTERVLNYDGKLRYTRLAEKHFQGEWHKFPIALGYKGHWAVIERIRQRIREATAP